MTDAPTPIDKAITNAVLGSIRNWGMNVDTGDFEGTLRLAGYVVVPMELLAELAGDVEAYVVQEFDRTEGYPSMQAKKAAAMEPVLRARALIAAGERK